MVDFQARCRQPHPPSFGLTGRGFADDLRCDPVGFPRPFRPNSSRVVGIRGVDRHAPRVSPWAGVPRPFRPAGHGSHRLPGFHPGLDSLGPSGRPVQGSHRPPGFHPGAEFPPAFQAGRPRLAHTPGFHPGLVSIGLSGRPAHGSHSPPGFLPGLASIGLSGRTVRVPFAFFLLPFAFRIPPALGLAWHRGPAVR